MAIIQDWKISARAPRCHDTERPFEDGDEFYTCIFDDPESDGFLRRDYSAEAWERLGETLEADAFSFWKSLFKVPVKEGKEEVIEKHSAEGMLRQMVEADDPRTENARYILALMLERKKTLIPTDAKETETRRLLFYEHRQTGEVFIVADPKLKLSEIEEVQNEVSELLGGRRKPPAGEPEEESGSEGVGVGEPAQEPDDENAGAPESGGEQPAETEDEAVS